MESSQKSTSALFQVYLRLRPPPASNHLHTNLTPPERFLTVEVPGQDGQEFSPTHITLNPPNDNRRRAVEKFAFTKVFEEEASQLELFHGTGVLPLVEGVLGEQGSEGRDGLLATLGVTGSGKTHTILGSRSQRGLTQLALDLLFRSMSPNLLDPTFTTSLHATIAASDPSEAQVLSAQMFLETTYGESGYSRASSRAATPMRVRHPDIHLHPPSFNLYPALFGLSTGSPKSIRLVRESSPPLRLPVASIVPSYMSSTSSKDRKQFTKSPLKGDSMLPPTPRRNVLQRPSVLPQFPDISNITVPTDPNTEYAVVISMYEVYNDRIFDLLTPASRTASTKDYRRRPLLFKPTEQSPDRKVVAGLRKIICGNVSQALMVLDAGLHERRVAGTGSNSVSSRSHGFFCVEVKKRRKGRGMTASGWSGSTLTIVDLAGSERARDAKTQGATLAEAGKINESLMYLGQCLQMQSDAGNSTKPNLVPFRQCKLTELLFSNSFPSASNSSSTPSTSHTPHHRNPQKAIMIVTADPLGDFNATSQILRYSALAREITVPRIPSISATILGASTGARNFTGHSQPSDERATMEIAALEIARMSEEIDGLRDELAAEQDRRLEAEAMLEGAVERMGELEMEVREEVWSEMEARMRKEAESWKRVWEAERERGDAHLDRKLEILARAEIGSVDEDDKENLSEGDSELVVENQRLRMLVEKLRRELGARSPSKGSTGKRTALGERESENRGVGSLEGGMRSLRINGSGSGSGNVSASPVKRVRQLTARRWDLVEDGELL